MNYKVRTNKFDILIEPDIPKVSRVKAYNRKKSL